MFENMAANFDIGFSCPIDQIVFKKVNIQL